MVGRCEVFFSKIPWHPAVKSEAFEPYSLIRIWACFFSFKAEEGEIDNLNNLRVAAILQGSNKLSLCAF